MQCPDIVKNPAVIFQGFCSQMEKRGRRWDALRSAPWETSAWAKGQSRRRSQRNVAIWSRSLKSTKVQEWKDPGVMKFSCLETRFTQILCPRHRKCLWYVPPGQLRHLQHHLLHRVREQVWLWRSSLCKHGQQSQRGHQTCRLRPHLGKICSTFHLVLSKTYGKNGPHP